MPSRNPASSNAAWESTRRRTNYFPLLLADEGERSRSNQSRVLSCRARKSAVRRAAHSWRPDPRSGQLPLALEMALIDAGGPESPPTRLRTRGRTAIRGTLASNRPCASTPPRGGRSRGCRECGKTQPEFAGDENSGEFPGGAGDRSVMTPPPLSLLRPPRPPIVQVGGVLVAGSTRNHARHASTDWLPALPTCQDRPRPAA